MMNKEIAKALQALQDNKIIVYPTDTVWGIGCDATNEAVVKQVYALKQREESKSLIILVDSVEMLQNYIEAIPSDALAIINTATKPTTIIYNAPINLAKNTIAKNNTIAIRIPNSEFCKELIKQFGKPIVSTSANISGAPTPKSFKEIDNRILKNVDYIVNLYQENICEKSSTILKFNEENEIEIVRI